jgi:hypothetical protein
MSATGARTQDTERAGYRWRPTRITSKDARYASFIAFIAWVFSVYDFILFGTLLPEMRATSAGPRATPRPSRRSSASGPSSWPCSSGR